MIRDVWHISAVLFLLIFKIVFWIIGLRVIFIRVITPFEKVLYYGTPYTMYENMDISRFPSIDQISIKSYCYRAL